jgi:hypothetical protein
MKRREFITLLAAAAAAWPVVARAQQPDGMRRIGVLLNAVEGDSDSLANLAAFLKAFQQLGWTAGRNVRIEIRWGGGPLRKEVAHAMTRKNNRVREHWAQRGFSPADLLNLRPI